MTGAADPSSALTRAVRLALRACRLRCPACGGGPIFDNWLTMRRECPSCGLRLERGEEGYVVGAYMFNIIAAELLFAVAFLVVVIWRWPSPPWEVLEYGGLVLMVAAPFLFYPFSRSLFLAFDLVFRPEADGDRGLPPLEHR
ncbi:MAG: DUF983 domain-containing protein [Gemmatimonadales bacterium]